MRFLGSETVRFIRTWTGSLSGVDGEILGTETGKKGSKVQNYLISDFGVKNETIKVKITSDEERHVEISGHMYILPSFRFGGLITLFHCFIPLQRSQDNITSEDL